MVVKLTYPYLMARTPANSITKQHDVSLTDVRKTKCGWDTSPWSVVYQDQLYVVLHCRLPGLQERGMMEYRRKKSKIDITCKREIGNINKDFWDWELTFDINPSQGTTITLTHADLVKLAQVIRPHLPTARRHLRGGR